jgi:hypothetical protein
MDGTHNGDCAPSQAKLGPLARLRLALTCVGTIVIHGLARPRPASNQRYDPLGSFPVLHITEWK